MGQLAKALAGKKCVAVSHASPLLRKRVATIEDVRSGKNVDVVFDDGLYPYRATLHLKGLRAPEQLGKIKRVGPVADSHTLYTEDDFTKDEIKRGNRIADAVIHNNARICKKCGAASSGDLYRNCKATYK